jgi:hypothetical protein
MVKRTFGRRDMTSFIRGLQVLEVEIHESNFDFPGIQAQIIRYCEKNQIPRKIDMHLQLIFEEDRPAADRSDS